MVSYLVMATGMGESVDFRLGFMFAHAPWLSEAVKHPERFWSEIHEVIVSK